MSYIQGENRNQHILFPESIEEYITASNPVRIIDEYVNQLNLKELNFTHSTLADTGRPPYHPRDLLKLYLYGYLNRIRSSRRLETETGRNIELMWLLAKLRPDFKTIADFRKDNKKAIVRVFRDFNSLCDYWSLFGKELIAIDGTKFRASNSKKNNFSQKKLVRHIAHIDERITDYLKALDETDELEATCHKPSAAEIKKRIAELKERKAKYESYQERLTATGCNELSVVDPDAHLMVTNNNSPEVCYNIQATVDAKHKLIADFKVSGKPNDLGQLAPMARRAQVILGKEELTVLADKGYYYAPDLAHCHQRRITTYVTKQTYANGTQDKDFYPDKFSYYPDTDSYLCPRGERLTYYKNRKKEGKIIGKGYRNLLACKDCPVKSRCTKAQSGRTIFRHKDQDFLDEIDRKTEVNLATYKLRQMIVEHPFGTVKRAWGASYFLTRGKHSVSAETALSFLSYNLRRVINILGVDEIIRRLRENRKPALV